MIRNGEVGQQVKPAVNGAHCCGVFFCIFGYSSMLYSSLICVVSLTDLIVLANLIIHLVSRSEQGNIRRQSFLPFCSGDVGKTQKLTSKLRQLTHY